MKKLFSILIMVSSCYYSFGQAKEENDKVFEKVELNAHTDKAQLTRYLKISIDLPDSVVAGIPPGTYRSEVQFVIDTHGYMGQFKLLKDPGYGLGERALQIIKKYPGQWQPASQCGRIVKAYRIQPIVFVIPKKE